jgi:hypothetical protein
VVGKPFLYRTTKEFLAHFGLDGLKDLPPLEEFEEMLGVELGAGPHGEERALRDDEDLDVEPGDSPVAVDAALPDAADEEE